MGQPVGSEVFFLQVQSPPLGLVYDMGISRGGEASAEGGVNRCAYQEVARQPPAMVLRNIKKRVLQRHFYEKITGCILQGVNDFLTFPGVKIEIT